MAMIKVEENKRINEDLKKLYEENTKEFLELWKDCFKGEKAPDRINEFGIIDPDNFDIEKRILVIGKETRGVCLSWEYPFLKWLNIMATKNINLEKKDKTKHPRMWYNIGKWAKLICNPELQKKENLEQLASEKKEALSGLSYIAYTNINKIGGGSSSGKSYRDLSNEELVIDMIIQEIEIIKPNHIILCDETFADILIHAYADEKHKNCVQLKKCIMDNNFYVMPHPAARKSNEKMLKTLQEQINDNNEYKSLYLYSRLVEETILKLKAIGIDTKKEDWHIKAKWLEFVNDSKEKDYGLIMYSKGTKLGTFCKGIVNLEHPETNKIVNYSLTKESEIEEISNRIIECFEKNN